VTWCSDCGAMPEDGVMEHDGNCQRARADALQARLATLEAEREVLATALGQALAEQARDRSVRKEPHTHLVNRSANAIKVNGRMFPPGSHIVVNWERDLIQLPRGTFDVRECERC
jgi:hypothetical protein